MTISIKNQKIILLVCVIVTSLVIVARDIMMVGISNTVLLFLFMFQFLCLSYSELLSFVFFIIPLTCGIPGYIVLLAAFFLIFKGRTWTSKQFIPFVIIALIELINEMTVPGVSIVNVFSFLSFIIVFFYCLHIKLNECNREDCIMFFSMGVALTFFVIFYNMILQYGISGLLSGTVRAGAWGAVDNDLEKMAGHLAMNANSIAYYSICVFSSLVVGFRKLRVNKVFLLFLICFALVSGVFSFSRTYLLCILLFVVLYLSLQSTHSKTTFIIVSVLLFSLLFLFEGELVNRLFEVFTDRIESDDSSTAGGRTQIFMAYNQKWSSSLLYILFGCGTINHMERLEMAKSIHCGLQQIWVCLGLSGFSLFLFELVSYLKKYIIRENLILALPFFISLVFNQSIQFLNPHSLLLPILCPLLVCQMQKG